LFQANRATPLGPISESLLSQSQQEETQGGISVSLRG
jgi:hypothetical protein